MGKGLRFGRIECGRRAPSPCGWLPARCTAPTFARQSSGLRVGGLAGEWRVGDLESALILTGPDALDRLIPGSLGRRGPITLGRSVDTEMYFPVRGVLQGC